MEVNRPSHPASRAAPILDARVQGSGPGGWGFGFETPGPRPQTRSPTNEPRAPIPLPATRQVPRTPRAPWRERVARYPWLAIALTLLVILSALLATSPVRDAATLGPMPEAHLSLPASYVAIAPISDVLDTLTLLTVPQHIALLVTAIVLYVVWRAWRLRRRPTTTGRVRREAGRATLFLLGVVLVYVAAAMMPRPMAAIAIDVPEVIVVDFHAHTLYSHDGRAGWTADDLRNWHHGAGFDAVYVTDHRSIQGAQRGLDGDPPQAGEGTMLLPGIEVFWDGVHVNLLSAASRYQGLITPSLADVDPDALRLASMVPNAEPIVVATIPDDLSKIHPAGGPGTAGVRAVEVIDGSPRGLRQSRRDRAKIVRLADSLDLALVAGSDNHGWGHAAAGWTALRIPGWRGMDADALAQGLELYIRRGRRRATRVVERVVADPGNSPVLLALTGPAVFWRMLTTLSGDERVLWVIWIWAIVLIVRGARWSGARRRAAA